MHNTAWYKALRGFGSKAGNVFMPFGTLGAARTRVARLLLMSTVVLVFFVVFSLMSMYVLYAFVGISSSNAVLYFIKDESGWLRVSNDLHFDEADRLFMMIDASCLFTFLERVASSATREPVLEMNWDRTYGRGILKEYRPDGTKFLVVLSRFKEPTGRPEGIFIGGDLAFGDIDRLKDRSRNNTGIAYFDGQQWRHIWCSLNEEIMIEGMDLPLAPWEWTYLGSKVLKDTANEIMIVSSHRIDTRTNAGMPVKLFMNRTFFKKQGDDHVLLKIEFINLGDASLKYVLSLGDEPWVGEFGDSSGDVGWTSGRTFKRESYLLPVVDRFAGFWDIGNDLAGERHTYTGYANFIEWVVNPPTIVYFANNFGVSDFSEGRVIDSRDNRIINLLWLDEYLQPKESRSYVLALGMAKPDPFTGLPVKPHVDVMGMLH